MMAPNHHCRLAFPPLRSAIPANSPSGNAPGIRVSSALASALTIFRTLSMPSRTSRSPAPTAPAGSGSRSIYATMR
jgi:hypothetical protein